MISPLPGSLEYASGIAYHSETVTERLRESGVDIVVLANVGPSEHRPWASRLWSPGVTAFRKIRRKIQAGHFDLVWLQHSIFLYGDGFRSALNPLWFILWCRVRGQKAIVEIHDLPSLKHIDSEYVREQNFNFPVLLARFGLWTIFSLLGFFSLRIVVHGEEFVDRLVAEYQVPKYKIDVLPILMPGVRPQAREHARALLGLESDVRIALFFGYASYYKGLPELLSAFEILSKRKEMNLLLIVASAMHPRLSKYEGYREYYSSLATIAAALPNVKWVGYVEDASVDRYFSACDFLILPYTRSVAGSGPLNLGRAHGRPALLSTALAPSNYPSARTFSPVPSEIATTVSSFIAGSCNDEPSEESSIRPFLEMLNRLAE